MHMFIFIHTAYIHTHIQTILDTLDTCACSRQVLDMPDEEVLRVAKFALEALPALSSFPTFQLCHTATRHAANTCAACETYS